MTPQLFYILKQPPDTFDPINVSPNILTKQHMCSSSKSLGIEQHSYLTIDVFVVKGHGFCHLMVRQSGLQLAPLTSHNCFRTANRSAFVAFEIWIIRSTVRYYGLWLVQRLFFLWIWRVPKHSPSNHPEHPSNILVTIITTELDYR